MDKDSALSPSPYALLRSVLNLNNAGREQPGLIDLVNSTPMDPVRFPDALDTLLEKGFLHITGGRTSYRHGKIGQVFGRLIGREMGVLSKFRAAARQASRSVLERDENKMALFAVFLERSVPAATTWRFAITFAGRAFFNRDKLEPLQTNRLFRPGIP